MGSVSALEWVLQEQYKNGAPDHGVAALLRQLPVNLSIVKPLDKQQLEGRVEYGPIVDHCISRYWYCLLSGLRAATPHPLPGASGSLIRIGDPSSLESIASLCVDYLDIVTVDLGTPLACLAVLVPKGVFTVLLVVLFSSRMLQVSLSFIVPVISSIWPLVIAPKPDLRQLLDALSAFLSVGFHECLLISQDPDLLQVQIQVLVIPYRYS